MKRLGKEYKLGICDVMSICYGSINKGCPNVIYISGHCWVSPTRLFNGYDIVSDIEDNIRCGIKEFLCNGFDFDKRFILDFDLSSDNLLIGSKKFLSFDLFLRQCDGSIKSLKCIRSILEGRFGLIINDLHHFLCSNGFLVSRKKNC